MPNLASDGPTSYTWNARNQLTSLSGGTSASFAYDGVGRRRGKTISGTTTNFLYDSLNLVQELSSGGMPTANLLTGLEIDETLTRTDGSGTSTLLTDALGSTFALTDSAGVTQTQYTYEPFGATAALGSASSNPSQHTGRENDGTSLYFYRARYYSPQWQRFVIGFRGGDINVARYVGNNPLGYRDPSGHLAPLLVLPIAGCIGGAAGAALGNAMAGRKTTWGDLAAGCGLGLGIGIGAGIGFGAAAGAKAAEADATLQHFLRQLERDGVRSLERSLRSLERNIVEHLEKLAQAKQAGGPTSSLQRELSTFRHQVDVIKQILAGLR